MAGKYSFQLEHANRRRPLPHKIILGQKESETTRHVLLKLFAYLLFYRDRLQIEPRLSDDNIPYEPDLVQIDYSMQIVLWVECGECGLEKLDRLAVKVPDAELWVIKSTFSEVEHLLQMMAKHELRRQRYRLLGLDAEMFDEVSGLLETRNRVFWVDGRFDPPAMQFEFNGLWFDAPFRWVMF